MGKARGAAASAQSTDVAANDEKGRVRLSLDLSPELNELLERLAVAIDGTKSEVLRKGIKLVEVAERAQRQGKKFGIAEPDQPLITEIVGL
jgi:predicted transcriptional regulator